MGDQVTSVRKREVSNNIDVETVKLLDFADEMVVNSLVRAVINAEAEDILEEVLNILSNSETSSSTRRLRKELKQLLQDPRFVQAKTNTKSPIPLPNGIIKLLKANMAVDEKKTILETVFKKVNSVDSLAEINEFQEFQAVPREGRYTSESFPYESLLQNAPNEQPGKKHDFSNCKTQPDGSCCVSKVQEKDRLERDDIKECWHKNVTTCYDSYVTEFTSEEEEECEDVFYKNCVIDFKKVPFDYNIKSCHTPMVKDCSENTIGKEICRNVFETVCNTTYDDQWKPQTSCLKHPQEICAPSSCQIVPGQEKCMTKTLVSTSYKPVETCDLQPQTHCTIITKPVPQLKVVPNCYTEEKEVCKRKQGEPKQVGKQVLVKWCKRADEPGNNQVSNSVTDVVRLRDQDEGSLSSYVGSRPDFTIDKANVRSKHRN